MRKLTTCVTLSVTFAASAAYGQAAAQKTEKVEPVAVVGCLKEPKPNQWMLVAASDPTPSTANAPSAKELAALPKGGKSQFELIGVTVFNLPSHRDHSVVVKGLPIKASPNMRINVTSVTMVAASCAP